MMMSYTTPTIGKATNANNGGDYTDAQAKKETIPGTKVFVLGQAKRYQLEDDAELIIDNRGVRILNDEDSGDD